MAAAKKIILHNGVSMLPARKAARRLGCAPDYIGKLCREGKLECLREGNSWFIAEKSILAFEKTREVARKERAEALARERRSEQEAYRRARGLPTSSEVLPQASSSIRPARGLLRTLQGRTLATALGILLFVGTLGLSGASALVSKLNGATALSENLTAALAQIPSPFFSTRSVVLSFEGGENKIAGFIRGVLASLFAPEESLPIAQVPLQPEPPATQPQGGTVSAPTVPALPPVSPTVARIVERISEGDWIPTDTLVVILGELHRSLRADITRIVGDSIQGSVEGLSGGGLTTITDADVPDDLTASNYLPLVGGTLTGTLDISSSGTSTWVGPLSLERLNTSATSTLAGVQISNLDCTGYGNSGKLTTDADGNVVCASDIAGSGSGTPGGSAGDVQYNDGAGGFGAEAAFDYSSSEDRLTVPYASTTGITASYASSTNLFAGNLFVGTLTGPLQAIGGTVSASSSLVDTYISDALTISGGTINSTPIGASSASTAIFTNATSTSATTTNFAILGLTSQLLRTDGNGVVRGTTIGSGLSFDGTTLSNTLGFSFTSSNYAGQVVNSTSTGLWLTGSPLSLIASSTFATNATTTFATTTQFAITGRQNALLSTDANGTVVSTTSVGANYLTGTLPVANGGTGQTTFSTSQLIYGNGTNALSSVGTSSLTIGSGLNFSGTAGALVGGTNLTIQAQIATSSVPTVGNLVYWTGNGTPSTVGSVATNTVTCSSGISCTSFDVLASSPISLTNTLGFSFTSSNYAGQVVNSTSTGLWLTGSPLSLIASSTFATNATTTFATTTQFAITGRQNALLSTDANGTVVSTTSIGVNYLSGTLGIANGGTNASAIGAHQILTFDGTRIVASSTPVAARYVATSSSASVFPYSSSTALTADTLFSTFATTSNLAITNLLGKLLSTDINGSVIATTSIGVNYLTGTLGIANGGTGASTFTQGWLYTDGGTGALAASTSPTVNYLFATSTTASSTLLGGLSVSGSLRLPNLTSCDTLDTNVNGYIVCGADSSGAGGADFTYSANYGGQTVSATSTGLWLTGSPLSLIASSTFATNATTTFATTTQFAITGRQNALLATDANGTVVGTTSVGANYLTGTLPVANGGTGASTFTQGWLYTDGGTGALAASTSPTVNYLFATSTTASSTLLGGLSVSGSLRLPNLTGCDSLDTNANGYVVCGIDSVGAGADWPFTLSNYDGQSVQATTSGLWLTGSPLSLIASSTFTTNATTTNATSTNLFVSNLTISSLTGPLQAIGGVVSASSTLVDAYITNALTIDGGTINNTPIGASSASTAVFTNATATNATTTNLQVSNLASSSALIVSGNSNTRSLTLGGLTGASTRCLQVDSSGVVSATSLGCGTGSGESQWEFFNNSGVRLGTSTNQVLIGASATTSLAQLEVIASTTVANSIAAYFRGLVGVGTSSPASLFALHARNGETNRTLFSIASSTANSTTTLFTINNIGSVGVGTSSPYQKFSVAGGNILQAASGDPTLASSTPTAGSSNAVYVSGRFAYSAEGGAGLRIYDISNPKSPSLSGTLALSGAQSIVVSGRYAYVGSTASGFNVVDVSNPASPLLLGNVAFTNAYDIALSGRYAYVTQLGTLPLGDGSLRIIDISDPTHPWQVGTYAASGNPYTVAVSGKYAYLGDYTLANIRILDVSNPSSPSLVGTYSATTITPTDLYISGKYLYVADESNGFSIVNVSNPASPSLVGQYGSGGSHYGVVVAGRYAYIANFATAALDVVDVGNPTSPILVGSYTSGASPFGLFVAGKYAYLASGSGGLHIVDINGAEIPSADIGSLAANVVNIADSLNVGSDIYAGGGLSVGLSGIFSRGAITAHVASTTARNPTAGSFMGGNVGIGSSTPTARLTILANTSDTFTNTLFLIASSTPTATTTLFEVSNTGSTTIAGQLNSALANFLASTTLAGSSLLSQATTSAFAITGLPSALLTTNAQGSVVASSTLTVAYGGTGASIFGQGWIYSQGGNGALAASTSPTVNYLTATSTSATSTFAWAIRATCFSTDGNTCVTGSGSGITLLGPANQLQNGPTVTLATSSTPFNGLTASTTITATGDEITFTNTLAGSLGDGGIDDNLTISGGTIDNTPIGASSASTAVFTNATATNATTTILAVSSVASTSNLVISSTGGSGTRCLQVNSTGSVSASASGCASGGADFTYSANYGGQTVSATSTGLWLTGSPLSLIASSTFATNATTTFATTTNFAITGLLGKLLSTDANGTVVGTTSVGANYITGTLPVANGGTGANTFSTNQLTYFNGTNLVSASSTAINNTAQFVGLGTTSPRWLLQLSTSTGPQLTLTDASATNAPFNFRTINSSLYFSTSSPSTFATTSLDLLTLNSQTGSTTALKLDVVGTATSSFTGNGINLNAGCFAINNVCITSSSAVNAFDFTYSANYGGQTVSATSTGLWLTGSPLSLIASSTFTTNATTTNATTTNLFVSNSFIAAASSTIGAGTQSTGLTISGGATTTGSAYFASKVGVGTTSPFATLSIHAKTSDPFRSALFAIGSSTASATTTLFLVTSAGNVGLSNNATLNFGSLYPTGPTGYGLRENGGLVEFRNAYGSTTAMASNWTPLASLASVSYKLQETGWSDTGSTLPGALYAPALVLVGDNIYLFGGRNSGGSQTNVIYRAPLSNPTSWSDTGSTIPNSIEASNPAVVGDHIYLFGGYNGTAGIANIYRAPISNPTSWSDLGAILPGIISDATLFSVGDYLYLLGGFSSGGATRSSLFRAPISNPTSWVDTGITLPYAVRGAQVAVVGDYIYVFGGYLTSGAALNRIMRAPVSNPTSWSDTGARLPLTLGDSQLAVVGDYLYLFGGYNGSSRTSAIYRAPVSNPLSWSDTGATVPAAYSGGRLAVVNDSIYSFGGFTSVAINNIYRTGLAPNASQFDTNSWALRPNPSKGPFFQATSSNNSVSFLSGSVGIGSSSPSALLSIFANATTSGGAAAAPTTLFAVGSTTGTATTSLFEISNTGSTTIAGQLNSTLANYFASTTLSGSTLLANATTTNFAITGLLGKLLATDANGTVVGTTSVGANYITGTLPVANGGTGASTFTQGWLYTDGGTGALAASTSPTVNYLFATSTTASSTLLGGLSVSGSLRLPNLTGCDSLDTNANGYIVCGIDSVGAGADWPFTLSNYDGQSVQATTSGLWLTGSPLSLIASSTFTTNATTTNATTTNFAITGLLGKLLSTDANGTVVGTTSIGVNYLTGTLPVANGGTGQVTFSAGQLLYGNGTNALQSVATSAATCSGGTSCSSFTVVGSVAPDISSFTYPFSISNYGGQTVSATSTGLWLTGSPLSLIASSTFATNATTTFATTTQFAITGRTNALLSTDANGTVVSTTSVGANYITGTLPVANGGTGASTFTQGWLYTDGGTGALAASTSPTVNYLFATSTTASSTLLGGLSVSGSLRLPNLTSCDSLDTNTNGYIVCGADSSGFDFTYSQTNFGQTVSSTSTPIWFQAGLQSSSTAQFSQTNVWGGLNFATSSLTASSTLVSFNGQTFLTASTTGLNTSLGINALSNVRGAKRNTAFGFGALQFATTSQVTDNVAIGYMALNGTSTAQTFNTFSIAIGNYALGSSTLGQVNVAIGDHSLFANTTGNQNVAIGGSALQSNTTGLNNVAIGGNSTFDTNTTGSYNIALGTNALTANITGDRNLTIGYDSLKANTAGTGNVALGYSALLAHSGDYTVAVGSFAGAQDAPGSYGNLHIGSFSGVTPGYAALTGHNNIAIGYDAFLPSESASNQLSIGNLIFGTLPATSTVNENAGSITFPTTGSIGIASTSPFAKFSIHTNNGDTETTLFTIGSSTASATTTLFSISNTGSTTIGLFGACSGSSALNTTASGLITCGATSGGGGADFTYSANYGGQTVSATSTGLWLTGSPLSLIASSTFTTNATTTNATTTNLGFTNLANAILSTNASGNVVATTSIGANYITGLGNSFFQQNGNSFGALATLGTNDGNALAFETNNTEYARLTTTGDFGIGTTTPRWTLQVASTTPYLALTDTDAVDGDMHWLISGLDGVFRIGETNGAFNDGTTTALRLDTDNNIFSVGDDTLGNLGEGVSELIAIGGAALSSNTTGIVNTAIGGSALQSNQTGSENLAVGSEALNLSTGSFNIALGGKAGNSLTSGNRNIIIGYDIDAPTAAATGTLTIGNLIYGTGLNNVLGTQLATSSTVGISSSSPYSLFGIHANNGGNLTTLFAIGSSTASATTTHFVVTNAGNVGVGTSSPWAALSVLDEALNGPIFAVAGESGTLGLIVNVGADDTPVVGVGTSSPFAEFAIHANHQASNFNRTVFAIGSSTAAGVPSTLFTINNVGSTTAANGFNITAGCFAVNDVCITSSSAVNAFDFTYSQTNFGQTVSATSTALWLQGAPYSLMASSTSQFDTAALGLLRFNATTSTSTLAQFGSRSFIVASTTDFDSGLIAGGNLGIGIDALSSATAGVASQGGKNTAFGYQALSLNTIGFSNTAIGFQAGASTTEGVRNTFVGDGAGLLTTTGTDNTFIGSRTGDSNTTGINNTAVGESALTSNLTGGSNTALGMSALALNQTGSSNVAIGPNTIGFGTTASNNTAVGYLALLSVNTGPNNTAVGSQAGYRVSSGYSNTLIGDNTTTNNVITTGFGNLGLGSNVFFPSATANQQLNIGNLVYGTLPATSTAFVLPTTGAIGVATSSPFATLSVHANNGSTNTTLFAIGSSTASATTTLFSVDRSGTTTIGLFGACSGSSALNTTASGVISCGAVTASGGADFTYSANYGGQTVSATTTGLWLTGSPLSLIASSTFATNATTTFATTTNLAISSLTADRIPFVSTGGNLVDSASLTFDSGSNLLTIEGLTGTFVTLSDNAESVDLNILSKLSNSNTVFELLAGPGDSLQLSTNNIADNGLRIDTGGNVGIGTTTPRWTLQVASATPYIAITDTDAAADDKHWLVSALDGVFRIGTSNDALNSTTSVLHADVALNNYGFGENSLINTSGQSNTALGDNALTSNTTGSFNTGIGANAFLGNETGSSNVGIGHGVLNGSTNVGDNNVAVGRLSLFQSTSDNNVAFGFQAGRTITSGYANIMLGTHVSTENVITTGDGNIGLGNELYFSSTTANNQLNIGNILYGTLPATSTAFRLPTTGAIGVATSSPFATLSVHANNGSTNTTLFAIGSSTASATTTLFSISNTGSTTIGLFGACSGSSALNTTAAGVISCGAVTASGGADFTYSQTNFGQTVSATSTALWLQGAPYSLMASSTSQFDTAALGLLRFNATTSTSTLAQFGGQSFITASVSLANTSLGLNALGRATGDSNSAVGSNALAANTTGIENVAFGADTLFANISGSGNVAVGQRTLFVSTAGSNNTAVGNRALSVATGDYNVALGYWAGKYISSGYSNIIVGSRVSDTQDITTGDNNIGIGNELWFPSLTSNNQLNIGNLVYGTLPATTTEFSLPTTGAIGVATSSPFATLSIHANNGSTNTTLFAIGSSTASATTTLFSVDRSGTTTIGLFGACSGSSALNTTASGVISCGAVTASGGADFTYSANYGGQTVSATTTGLWLTGSPLSLIASSTFITNATTTNATTTTFAVMQRAQFGGTATSTFTSTGYLGIGTSSPYANLSVTGLSAQASTSPLLALSSSTPLTGGAYLSVSGRGMLDARGRTIDPEFIAEEQGPEAGTSLNNASAVFVQGNYAYVASSSGFAVIDISNPYDPVFVAGEDNSTLASLTSIFVSGNYAYVTDDSQDSLHVIDISNPTNPIHVAEERPNDGDGALNDAEDVFVAGNYAYVTPVQRGTLAVVDISNPLDPIVVAEATTTTGGLNGSHSVFVQGNYAYVATSSGMAVVDISNPLRPLYISGEQGTTPGTTLDPDDIFVQGNYAYIVNNARDSLAILDISDPTDPVFVSEEVDTTLLNGAIGIFVSGNYAYITTSNRDSLAIVDISNPSDPRFVAEALGPTPGTSLNNSVSVFVQGNYAYVATFSRESLAVIDIGGAAISNLAVGTVHASNLLVDAFAQFGQGANVAGSLNVGTNALVSGALTITGSASSTLTTTSTSTALRVQSGRVAIGTSTPFANLSIHANNGSTATTLFAIGSSTASATTTLFAVTNAGRVAIGTSTPQAFISIDKNGNFASTSVTVAGLDQYYRFDIPGGGTQFGSRTYIVNDPTTAKNTLVGEILRIEDSTTTANTVRGIEVQAQRGTNTQGENTALSGFGRTFGVRGVTEGDAGGVLLPAGVFAQTRGTTQGNALRAYSGTITSETLVSLFHDTSVGFTGTGLEMNFGNSGGTFTGTFLDLQRAGTSKFSVSYHGTTTIGDGTNQAGLQIGFGGLCVDNDGSCTASTTGRISSVSSYLGNSDLAELYFANEELEAGEIVYTTGGLTVGRASQDDKQKIIGVVSTDPGLLIGSDDIATAEHEYPVALTGRVPVKVSTEGGEIEVGDRIVLSSIDGVGMKGTDTPIIGVALEAFDGTGNYHSEGVIASLKDSVSGLEEATTTVIEDVDTCYWGGGVELGSEECVDAEDTSEEIVVESNEEVVEDIEEENGPTEDMETPEGQEVKVGTVLVFVKLEFGIFAGLDMEALNAEIAEGGDTGIIAAFIEATLEYLASFAGVVFEQGMAMFDNLLAATITVENSLTVGTTERPAGITLFDEETGEPYCVVVSGGELVSKQGACGAMTASSTPQEPPPPAGGEPPPSGGEEGGGEVPPPPAGGEEPPAVTEESLPPAGGEEPPAAIEEPPAAEEPPAETSQEEPPAPVDEPAPEGDPPAEASPEPAI